MKARELKAKSENELSGELTRLRKELSELQIKARTGQLKNVRMVRKVRKDVARILTVLTNKA
jgi:large subunit ribosomal protein L29